MAMSAALMLTACSEEPMVTGGVTDAADSCGDDVVMTW